MDERTQKVVYLAGIFDGEGCVLICKRNPRRGRSLQYYIECCVNMQDGAPIRLLCDIFKGIYHIRQKSGNSPAAEWRVTNKQAVTFAKEILPYTIVKSPQLEVALEFVAKCKNKQRLGLLGGQRKLTETELAEQEAYKLKLSQMKKEHSV